MDYQNAVQKCEKYHQEHLLKFYDELNEAEKEQLLTQIEKTDFSVLDSLKHLEDVKKKGVITPLQSMTLNEIEPHREAFEHIGEEALRQGKVGAVLLAGGMGTRLGSDAPKGVYNIGLTRDLYIFECLINNLMDIVKRVDAWIPLFVMTSEKNHDATVDFFKEHRYFGYNEDEVWFFKQEMAPASDYEGKIYLETKSRLSTSPNGNGGWFSSMERNGLLDEILDSPIEWINVFSVDNVLQGIADPVFLGATITSGKTCGAKVVAKTSPDEKVGAICTMSGMPHIIEYYELSDKMMNEKNQDGTYAYGYGVILNYLFPVKKLTHTLDSDMPLHIVKKAVPFMDYDGSFVTPDEVNAFKYETLALDLIHAMDSCLAYEIDREKEFAPIKNKEGVDSIDSARELLVKNGVEL